MILLETSEVNGQPILRWEVWFRTIRGLHQTLDEAREHAVLTEMPFDLIRPTPVAVAESTYEECLK